MDKLLMKTKIEIVMKLRGVSREEARRIVRAGEAVKKEESDQGEGADEGAAPDGGVCRRKRRVSSTPWEISAKEFFGEE